MNNSVFVNNMVNWRTQSDQNLVTTEKRRNYLLSEPNYQSTKFFSENLLAIETKKPHIFMIKPVYLGLSILELSKIVMYEFWCDYLKSNSGKIAKLCSTDTDSFIVYIKTEDIYSCIAKDFETIFDTSNYELGRQLSKEKNKKVIGVMKDESGGNIMTEFAVLRAKTYSNLRNDSYENKKAKDTKKCVVK